MIDLCFADEKVRKQYTCSTCPPQQRQARNCESEGFNNYKVPKAPYDGAIKLTFCPAKATWYPDIAEVYTQCFVAYKTGILPKAGSFDYQDELFYEVFGTFVERYEFHRYQKIWQDVYEFTPKVLEAIAKMFSGKG